MATYTVTNTFTADTTAVASEVNQNFTDVLTALNAFDAGNLSSGTVPIARISGLTVTQIAATTLVLEAEGIGNNDNDTTWPTSAAVKDYVDSVNIMIQIVNTQDGALNNITTQIPDDDTIPQITEGEEIMTRTITPTSATNKLKIDVVVNGSNEAGLGFIVALFETTTHATNSIAAAVPQNFPAANRPTCVNFTHFMTAPGTSEYTFRVRMGSDVGESNFNGINTGRLLGGVLASSITITEYVA